MTDADVSMHDPRDYRTLSTREQAALLGRHREELACLISPCVMEEQVRDGTGVMLAERDALVFVNPETSDSAGARDVYIAYVLVRPGMRGKGFGGKILGAVRARFPDATLRLECLGPKRLAFFDRHGFIRAPAAQCGYVWMRSDPAQAKVSVDTPVWSMRRARGFDASA